MPGYNYKFVELGRFLKVVEYEREVKTGINKHYNRPLKKRNKLNFVSEGKKKETKVRGLKNKEIDDFHYLLYLNFKNYRDQLITLTYKENIAVEKACKDFERWIKRMRSKFGDFKYLAVRSFQKRGTIHYHVLVNIPRIPLEMLRNKEFENIWGHGGVNITKIYDVNVVYSQSKLSQYLVDNMQKFKKDERGYGKQAYTFSKNLKKPKVRTGNYDEFMKCLELINLEAIDEKGYKNEYRGDVKVTIYKKKGS
ncbi:rolling circle replication-associated protein [Bacillus wiedmannii]|uniref:RNA replicase n=1 Tax=Bacillus wiedmannii TaxID=1890302 RepID=A0ABX5DRK6_9BACI|nr:RNA replicase [Bacillus wiedmannii]PRT39166.1 RNA replicase [Bacillus wiedmannii]